jgi:hypothetical protein
MSNTSRQLAAQKLEFLGLNGIPRGLQDMEQTIEKAMLTGLSQDSRRMLTARRRK